MNKTRSPAEAAPARDSDAIPMVHDIFERRFKESVLEQTVGVFSERERELLMAQIDSLGRSLDSLVEATQQSA